jgi:hypothetical protein
MDAHGVLFEFEDDITKILDPGMTHFSIGLAWNNEKVKVVEFLSSKY